MRLSTLRIAWRNLWRNRKRTALALLAIAVGQWALLATQGLMRGYGDNIQRAITGPMIGHIQIHHPDYRDERAMDLAIEDLSERAKRIAALPEVADVAPRILAPVLMAPERDAFVATVLGVDVASESKPFGLLSGADGKLQRGSVMLGYRLAERSDARVGQEIAVVGQAADGSLANDLYTVQAIIRGPASMLNQSGVVMHIEDAQELMVMPDQAHEIVVRAQHADQVPQLLAEMKKIETLDQLEILPWRDLVPELVMIIDMVDYTGYFVLVLVLVAAVSGIVNTLMMATYERMHEFGMLLALGCRPGRIVRLILIEAMLIGLIGVLLGTALGAGFTVATSVHGIDMASWGGEHMDELAYGGINMPLHIYPRLELLDPVIGLVAVMVFSLLAAVWPAMVAGRLDPMEAMRT